MAALEPVSTTAPSTLITIGTSATSVSAGSQSPTTKAEDDALSATTSPRAKRKFS